MWILTGNVDYNSTEFHLKRTDCSFFSKKAVLVATAIPGNAFQNIRSLILSNIKITEIKKESVSKYIQTHALGLAMVEDTYDSLRWLALYKQQLDSLAIYLSISIWQLFPVYLPFTFSRCAPMLFTCCSSFHCTSGEQESPENTLTVAS